MKRYYVTAIVDVELKRTWAVIDRAARGVPYDPHRPRLLSEHDQRKDARADAARLNLTMARS